MALSNSGSWFSSVTNRFRMSARCSTRRSIWSDEQRQLDAPCFEQRLANGVHAPAAELAERLTAENAPRGSHGLLEVVGEGPPLLRCHGVDLLHDFGEMSIERTTCIFFPRGDPPLALRGSATGGRDDPALPVQRAGRRDPGPAPALPRVCTGARPIGLARGRFTVPDSFFEPLPDDVIESFEGGEVPSGR